MRFINSWKSQKKQSGKVAIKIRFGKLTVFDFYYDKKRKLTGLTLFNIGIKNANKKSYDKT